MFFKFIYDSLSIAAKAKRCIFAKNHNIYITNIRQQYVNFIHINQNHKFTPVCCMICSTYDTSNGVKLFTRLWCWSLPTIWKSHPTRSAWFVSSACRALFCRGRTLPGFAQRFLVCSSLWSSCGPSGPWWCSGFGPPLHAWSSSLQLLMRRMNEERDVGGELFSLKYIQDKHKPLKTCLC